MTRGSLKNRMKLLLVLAFFGCSVTSAAAQNFSPGLTSYAKDIIASSSIRLTGDIQCEVGSGKGNFDNAYNGSDARALLSVASKRKVYLFAHGFYPNPRRTKPSADYVRGVWWGHLDIIRNMGRPYAACLFLSDTSVGFGPLQPVIGDFLFALRALTDDAELYDGKRNIYLVGYSAGANYIKQAIVDFRNHLRRNEIEPTGTALTRMAVIFIAGVHHGTPITKLANSGVSLINNIGSLFDSALLRETGASTDYEINWQREWNAYERAERQVLVTSRGARQLRQGSHALAKLNQQFLAAWLDDMKVANVLSPADQIAPLSATLFPNILSTSVPGLSHHDFMSYPLPRVLREGMKKLYR